jgi:hypothetical protein
MGQGCGKAAASAFMIWQAALWRQGKWSQTPETKPVEPLGIRLTRMTGIATH